MASDLRGYTEQETLNKVLNTDNDSIQVDIVDATGVTITTSNDSVYADDADWTDSTSKHTLVGGLYQSTPQSITDGDVGPFQVDADGALHISDGGNTITVDGTVTANLGSTDNTVLDNIDSNTDYGATTGGGTESGALRVTIASNSTGVLSIDDNSGSITVALLAYSSSQVAVVSLRSNNFPALVPCSTTAYSGLSTDAYVLDNNDPSLTGIAILVT